MITHSVDAHINPELEKVLEDKVVAQEMIRAFINGERSVTVEVNGEQYEFNS